MFVSGNPIPVSCIPDDLLASVGPDAPERVKGLTSRALLPMPPDRLSVALACLSRDSDAAIAATAVESLRALPRDVLLAMVTDADLPGEILDVFGHLFLEDEEIEQALITNRAVCDDTVRWLARKGRGLILDAIASNQVRLLRCFEIIESLILNAATATPTLARVVETAVRSDIDIQKVKGLKPLAEAFFSDLQSVRSEDFESTDAIPEALVDSLKIGELEEVAEDQSSSLAPAAMEVLLQGGIPVVEEEDSDGVKPLWKMINDMSIPDKVRLALAGSTEARKILIKDPKRIVANSVLRSPMLTEKEVAYFCTDKALSAEIVQIIARSREWTRTYAVRLSLLWNPKCPTRRVSTFLNGLRRKDLVQLARAKDVPAHVSRAAKQIKNKRGW